MGGDGYGSHSLTVGGVSPPAENGESLAQVRWTPGELREVSRCGGVYRQMVSTASDPSISRQVLCAWNQAGLSAGTGT